MIRFIGIGIALFLLAIVFVVLSQGRDLAALFNAFAAEPFIVKLAWTIIVVAPLVLLPATAWLCDALQRQRSAAKALELRLDGVRAGTKELARSQIDAETSLQHLTRTDPEDAVAEIRERIAAGRHLVEIQQNRNEIGDLQSRVDAVRAEQETLRQHLAPVLDKRRAIEQMFVELDSRQTDIERALAEMVAGADGVTLDVRLKKLADFVSDNNARCDEIEQGLATIARLKRDYAALTKRLAPLAAADDGVAVRIKELNEAREALSRDVQSLQQTPQGALADRVQAFAADKKSLEDGVSNLSLQFAKLASLRNDIDALFAAFDRALDQLSIAGGDDEADSDARVEELSAFIATTQLQVTDIERKLAVFGQLRVKLEDLQSRLGPLEAEDSGMVSVIAAVRDACARLLAKLDRLEQGDDGDLAARIKKLGETKRELEARVIDVTEQFTRLAGIRKDIAGLFDKLSAAVGGST